MDGAKRCHNEGCDNFTGSNGQCNACGSSEKPNTEKRKRDEEAAESVQSGRAEKRRTEAFIQSTSGAEVDLVASAGNDDGSEEEDEDFIPTEEVEPKEEFDEGGSEPDEVDEGHEPCARCGGHEMLALYNKAPDNNYYTLPSGRKGPEGSMLYLPGLTHGEGVDFKVCIDCGTLAGFDSEAFKAAIAEEEARLAE